jgi:signal peptidase II
VQNTGAAWSMFEGMQWMFALIFLVLTVAVLYEYFKSPLPFSTFERWCIAAIYGGGLGNMIDRVRLGYVIDMIKTDFMVFPVFNVADCFITCGCFAMIFSLLFINKAFWKDDKK